MVFTQQNRLGADDQQSSKRIHRPCSEKNFRAVLKVANASDADRRPQIGTGPAEQQQGPVGDKPGARPDLLFVGAAAVLRDARGSLVCLGAAWSAPSLFVCAA